MKTQTEIKQTPTPFDKLGIRIIDQDSQMVTLGFLQNGISTFAKGQRVETQELINQLRTAVNSHEALINCLQNLHDDLEDSGDGYNPETGKPYSSFEEAKKLLQNIRRA